MKDGTALDNLETFCLLITTLCRDLRETQAVVEALRAEQRHTDRAIATLRQVAAAAREYRADCVREADLARREMLEEAIVAEGVAAEAGSRLDDALTALEDA